MTEPTLTPPPWTEEQVTSANDYQQAGVMHPFTCPNRGDGQHLTTVDLGVLVATTDGWVCPSCDYTQHWAHPWMLDDRWRELTNPFA